MELYFSPLACSLATRIALYEAGAEAAFVEVDTKRKRVQDGSDFLAINPLGQVPVLRTDDGALLTENAAILPFVADAFPAAKLAPLGGFERARMQQWLGFIGTELHKAVFVPLLDPHAPGEVKRYARDEVDVRFDVLHARFAQHDYLLDTFSVADAYLTVVLNWTRYVDIDLARWPAVQAYYERITARPAVADAMREEMALYRAAQARRQS
jgi:glutathione S-transferase